MAAFEAEVLDVGAGRFGDPQPVQGEQGDQRMLSRLDLLTCEEASQLLSRRIGASRVAAEPQAAEKIIALCTRLPMALSIVAARAAAHPGFSLETLAAELCHAPCAPLGALDGGDRVTDMRAVFHWSYRQLSASAARLFRLLGLHGGPDVTAPAAASLAGLPQQAVWPLLTELTLAHMVTEHVAGRFALHDLLRAYAAEHANIRNVDDERQAAVRRMLDHYLHSAYNAAIWLHPRASPITLAPPVPGVVPQQLADDTAALAWFEAEYPVLLRTIKLSADTGQTVHAWQLPWTLTEFFARRGHWHDWAASQDIALVAAQHGADRHGQAHSHRGLGQAWYRLGRYDQAHEHFQQAIRLFQELSDQAGQADTHLALGWMLGYQGRPEEALRHAQQALSLTQTTGSRHGQARALLSVGWDHALLGEYEQAISCCQQALALFRQFGDRRSESRTLDGLGYAHYHLGGHQQAIAYFRQALVLYRELGDRHGQAITLNHLGDAHHATADLDAAGEAWQQAIGILEQLGAVVTETSTQAAGAWTCAVRNTPG